MPRYILDESKIHPSIRSVVESNHRDIVEEVIKAVEQNPILVIGMSGNPNCSRACKLLDKQKKQYKYLEYGSYFKEWRKRNALKMWTGWKTFPMVFVNGMLVGGADDLQKLIQGNELENIQATAQ